MKKFLLVWLFASAASPLLAFDDHNPIGVTGAFEGVITTGCAYNVLNHNATRQIDDIVVPGSIGKYPLKMTRYYNSRSTFGYGILGPGWSHEYLWTSGNDRVKYPNGNVWDSHCTGEWGLGGPLGISDWPTTWNGYPAFRLADGGTVVFENPNWGVATKIIDPYGQTTSITLDSSGQITRVTEPGGRYLQFAYTTYNGVQVLNRVDAYDGQGHQIDWVMYHYASKPTGGSIVPTAVCLTSVDYSDGQHATYTYTTDNSPENPTPPCPCPLKLLPLLQTAQDVRYKGPMRQICYEYQANGPHGAIIAERYSLNGSTTGPRVSRIDPPAPSPLLQAVTFPTTYTEYRGDGPTRRFSYTALSVGRPPNEEECPSINGPAPQQFLQSYTDFKVPANSTQLGYDPNWYVNSVRDANMHTTYYDRGPPPNAYPGPKGIGQITKITHPGGAHIDYTYYGEGSGNISGHYVQTVSNERQKVTTYTRSPTTPPTAHLVTRIDYPSDANTPASFEAFTYNSFGQVLTHRLKNLAYESFVYGGRGLLIDKYNPKQGGVPTGTDPHTHYTYYTSGPWTDRVQTVTLPANGSGYSATETYEYDRALDANGVTNPNGAAKAGRGLVTKITHGGDNTYQSFGYDAYGNKRWEENELRKRTSYTYDDYNRVLTVKDPIGQTTGRTTSYTYLPTNGNGTSPYVHTTNNADTATTPTGIVTTNDYDENFRKISSTAAYLTSDAATTWFHYDPVGNQDWVTDPRGTVGRTYPNGDPAYTTHSDYDGGNRNWRVREPLGRTTWFEFGDNINVTEIHRADGTVEQKTYDAMNRVLSDTVPQTASVNVTTSFIYNPSGTIQQVTDPGARQTRFDYDASDEKITMTYPGGIQSQSWTYDDAHNLVSRTTVGGKIEQFTYDIRNRKDTMISGIPNPVTWIKWAHYIYDDASHLATASNGTGVWGQNVVSIITRQYDAAGHLTLDQQNVNGLGIKNVYYPLHDADGKLTRMYVAGASPAYDYTFDYDDMGRFETIKPTGGSAVFQYHYDAASNEVQRDNLQNGVQQIYPRDNLNRMLYLNLSNGLSHEGYEYDAMNRLRSVTRQGNLTDSFTYYLNGELHTAFYDRTNRNVNYALSRAGNRTSVVDDGATTTYTPNAFNQYSNVTGSTIHNGNEHEIDQYKGPSDAQLVSYTYLTDRDLVSVTSDSDSYSLAYDALGRCVKRDLNGVTTYYIYDGERPILDYNSSGTIIARNVYGKGVDEILMRTNLGVNSGQPFYYAQDHEGSVTHLLNSSGAVIERYRYDAFGAPTFFNGGGTQISSTAYNNRFLFTGREYAATYRNTYTPAFSFYEYRARAYNPTLGRFMSEDPKLFDAGDYNLFRYCHNDPIDFTDPMGLDAQAWIEAIVPGAYEYNQMVVNFHAGNYGTAAGWAGTMLVSQYAAVVSGTSSTRAQAGFRAARAAVAEGKAVSRTGYRYVGEKEARTISREGTIPLVDQKNRPKTVFYTDEKFTNGKAAKTGLDLDSKPTHRVEFSMDHAPAGSGRLTDHGRVEFTLREGAEPIRANKLTLLNDAAPELEQDMASRHFPPKLDR